MSKQEHDFHIVNPSPMPVLSSMSLLLLTSGAVLFMHNYPLGKFLLPLGFAAIFSCMYYWWKDVVHEGRVDNAHSARVQKGLSLGMSLFIFSEVMFFFAFFWSFFKAWLDPAMLVDGVWATVQSSWPPEGVKTFDPWDIPLINTVILLLSGTTVTWAHYELLNNNRKKLVRALQYTVALGICFTMLQAYEYYHAAFGFRDGIYSSNFYMATGFHGAHVLIGTIFLSVCLARAKKGHFDKGNGHLGFEFAAWYWHFVDVVWLFLFVFVYVFAG
jgi:cytochrome c oxidase subunit III